MTDQSILGTEEKLFVTRLLHDEPGLGIALDWAKRLNAMLRHKAVEKLDDVLIAGTGTMLARFSAGLRRDFDAINAALELPWTTSPVEGQVSRIKMLKRTMYGRAGFELLHARVLQAAQYQLQRPSARRVRENLKFVQNSRRMKSRSAGVKRLVSKLAMLAR